MPEYEKDTLYRPETKKSGSLAYKIGQAIAILIQKVPYFETSNNYDGVTVYIAEEVNQNA